MALALLTRAQACRGAGRLNTGRVAGAFGWCRNAGSVARRDRGNGGLAAAAAAQNALRGRVREAAAAATTATGRRKEYGTASPVMHASVSPQSCDLLVVGCGIAGASAALKAAAAGMRVTMLSAAADPADCNSYWAQGGIIYKAKDDAPELLASDVHSAGAGICDNDAVMHLAREGPRRVEELLLRVARVPFDRDAAGELALCLEASHNRARIIHWRDQTGKAITEAVQAAAAAHPNIRVVPRATAVDLALAFGDGWEMYGAGWEADHGSNLGSDRCLGLNPGLQCVGAHVFLGDCSGGNGGDGGDGGRMETILASATVLATGGLGEIYAHTSNPASARGDGFAMALRAGAAMRNMEYVQFHPTTLHLPGQRSFLLTEALRGEGARLRSADGRAFACDYHPAGELAPRDVVSRMIVAEMRRLGESHMFLDITHRDADWLRGRFPAIHAHCLERGLDVTCDPLPVVPAAHYFCGGVMTDLQGRTTLPGLFAAGEVACTGLHGGNRLASTSLLEGLVWGCAIADHLAGPSARLGGRHRRLDLLARRAERVSMLPFQHDGTAAADGTLVADGWRGLQTAMWEGVGVVRTRSGLREALRTLEGLHAEADDMFWGSAISPATVGLRNAVHTAALVTQAAAANPRSVGAHFVEDSEHADEDEHDNDHEEEARVAVAS